MEHLLDSSPPAAKPPLKPMAARGMDWLLGADLRGRGYIRLTLLAVAVYGLFALNMAAQVMLGLMQAGPARWLSAVSLTGIVGFYLLLRSGLSRRLGPDPSLTLPQQVFGAVVTAWGYAIDPALRGAVIAIMLLNWSGACSCCRIARSSGSTCSAWACSAR